VKLDKVHEVIKDYLAEKQKADSEKIAAEFNDTEIDISS
jgi:hypothetical protein